jgi:hypothetical protein
MSGLFRRIPSIAFVVLFALVGVEAQAGYLFKLTEAEIDSVMSHYSPKGYDRDVVLRQMSEPFDCASFGDLCRDVGEEYALQIVENVWTLARQRVPIDTIDRSFQEDLESYELRWFERLFPDGVSARFVLGRVR